MPETGRYVVPAAVALVLLDVAIYGALAWLALRTGRRLGLWKGKP